MKNKLLFLYTFLLQNWVVLSVLVTLFGVRLLGWHWITILIVPVLSWSTFVVIDRVGPLRILLWPLVKSQTRRIVMAHASPIITYPMVLWLEMEGWQTYRAGGHRAFQEASLQRLQVIVDGLAAQWEGFARSIDDHECRKYGV